jgi:hypothetical protein
MNETCYLASWKDGIVAVMDMNIHVGILLRHLLSRARVAQSLEFLNDIYVLFPENSGLHCSSEPIHDFSMHFICHPEPRVVDIPAHWPEDGEDNRLFQVSESKSVHEKFVINPAE